MKTKTVNQEILLMTTTTLSRREWCERDPRNSKPSSAADQLEEACWNGLLDELMPEIIEKSPSGKHLSLWQITHFSSFLEIELSEAPVRYEDRFSVNPYLFVPTLCEN